MIRTQQKPKKLSPIQLESIREEIAREREFGRKIHTEMFEEDRNDMRKNLNPTFLKEIVEYLYNRGPVPRRMDCWDAPIDWLKERGLAEEIIREDLLKN